MNVFIVVLGSASGASGVTPGMLVKPWVSHERSTAPAGLSADARPSHLGDNGSIANANHGNILRSTISRFLITHTLPTS